MKILLSPLHYVLDAKHSGSEFSWAYSIYSQLEKNSVHSFAYITGGVRGITNNKVFSTETFNPKQIEINFIAVLIFYIKTFLEIQKYQDRHKADIIHHFLPFALNKTFNIYALLHKNIPFIIGPVQSPLDVSDIDQSKKSARGFEKSSFSLKETCINAVVQSLQLLWSFLSHKTIHRADHIIVINSLLKNELCDKGISPEKISVIYPGIDCSRFNLERKTKNSKKISLCVVSYLLDRKGVNYVIEAIAQLPPQIQGKIQLSIYGDGPQKENLTALVNSHSLHHCISFEGFVEQSMIPQVYASHDIFISMSKSESWGQMYTEAMSAGCCVIAAKNRGSEEILKDINAGILVSQEDSTMLAKEIENLVCNPNKIQNYGQYAQKYAQEHFDWGACIIPKYIAVYENIKKK